MRKLVTILLIFGLISLGNNVFAQKKQTYKVNGTSYIYGETYKSTGNAKVERSTSAKDKFLKNQGYKKEPKGYQVDHIVPLSEGGADVPSNMQLIPIEQHKSKTARERAYNNTSSTYKAPYYRSNSTYKSSNSYSTPSFSNGTSKTIYTGSKGGHYYINSNGNKTYVKKK
jgi:hypothetical protein